jgi:peptidoglycan glycosyltransferase
VNGQTLGCHRDPGRVRLTLVEALTFGCPRPFATLGQRLGARALEQLFNDLRFFEAPSIAIPTLAATPPGDEMDSVLVAIGQGPVTVTPLHLALATAALARDGEVPVPQLVLATQGPDSAWQSPAPLSHPIAAFGPDEADQVKALLPDGHSAIALTGAEGQRLAWFTGFAPFDDSRYAIAVLLEDGDVMRAEQIGRALLKSATHLSP